MQQGRVVDLTALLSLSAAHLSVEHRLPMADSIMLGTARTLDATLWTQDADFEGHTGRALHSQALTQAWLRCAGVGQAAIESFPSHRRAG